MMVKDVRMFRFRIFHKMFDLYVGFQNFKAPTREMPLESVVFESEEEAARWLKCFVVTSYGDENPKKADVVEIDYRTWVIGPGHVHVSLIEEDISIVANYDFD